MNNLRRVQYARIYYPSLYATSPAAILFITVSSRRRICLEPPLVLSSTSIGLKCANNTSPSCVRRPNTFLCVYGRGGMEAKALVDTTRWEEMISVVVLKHDDKIVLNRSNLATCCPCLPPNHVCAWLLGPSSSDPT